MSERKSLTVFTAKIAYPTQFDLKEGMKLSMIQGMAGVLPCAEGAKPVGTLLEVEYVTPEGERVQAKEWKAGTLFKTGTTPMVNFEEEDDGKR